MLRRLGLGALAGLLLLALSCAPRTSTLAPVRTEEPDPPPAAISDVPPRAAGDVAPRTLPPAPPLPAGKLLALVPRGPDWQLALHDGVWVEGFWWLDDHRALFYVQGAKAEETPPGMWLADLTAGTLRQVEHIGTGWWFRPFAWDEQRVVNLGSAADGQPAVVMTDLTSSQVVASWPATGAIWQALRRPNGPQIAYSEYHENREQYAGALRLIDVAKNRQWEVAPVGMPVGFLADGRLVFHRGERYGELAAVAPAEGAGPAVIHAQAFAATLAPDRTKVAFLLPAPPQTGLWDLLRPGVAVASPNRSSAPPNPRVDRLAIWDARTGRTQTQALPFAGYLVGLVWSPDGERLAAVITASDFMHAGPQAAKRTAIVQFGRPEPLLVDADHRLWGYGWWGDRFRYSISTNPGEPESTAEHWVSPDGRSGLLQAEETLPVPEGGSYVVYPRAGGLRLYHFAGDQVLGRLDWPTAEEVVPRVDVYNGQAWLLARQDTGQGGIRRYRFVHLEPLSE